MIDQSVREFDRRMHNVLLASYGTFCDRVSEFVRFIKSDPVFQIPYENLRSIRDFDKWIDDECRPPTGMVGSGKLAWPSAPAERFSLWLQLLERFQSWNEVVDFSTKYHYVDGDFDSYAYEIGGQYVRPFAEDFRVFVEDSNSSNPYLTAAKKFGDDDVIELDIGTDAHINAVNKLGEYIEAVEANNELASVAGSQRDQIISELKAANTLLKTPRLRLRPFLILLSGALFLISATVGGTLSAAGSDLWTYLKPVIGIDRGPVE